ncbi:CynX/NimT family MFS transporter [Niallia sp. JL1B1071]|uniref:MFS transporter n=1 Tax=Niallia tiangongensis TaxID=3237105 RepID=UPI0037DD11ED
MNMKKQTILMIIALFFVSFNLRISIAAISPVLENIRADLHLSNGIVSLLTAIPVICMGLFAFFAARISAHIGLEKTIVACLILIGTATALRAFSHSAFTLLLTAFFIGIGIAVAGPLVSGYIKQQFPHRIGIMIGVYSVGMGLGASFSAGFMLPLQKHLLHSWQLALASWSIFAVIGFLFWYPQITNQNKITLPSKRTTKLPWKNRKAWMFTLLFGLQSGIFYTISTWLAPIAQSMGFSSAKSGTLITFFTIIQMIFSFLIPTLADLFQKEKTWLLGSIGGVFIGLIFFLYPVVNPWFATGLIAIGLGGLFPLALALPLNATNSSNEASAWTSMMQGVGYMIGGIIPIMAGLTRDYIPYDKQVFVVMIILCFVMILTLSGWKEKRTITSTDA